MFDIYQLHIAFKVFYEKFGRFPIIAIEGIDGSGKSTISEKLANVIGGICVHTPSKEFTEIKSIFETDEKYYLARFYFYLSSIWYSYYSNVGIIKNYPLIYDRYTLSTRVYHSVLLYHLGVKNTSCIINNVQYPPSADINIILRVNVETALNRVRNRKIMSFDASIECNYEIQSDVMKAFLKCDECIINADFLSADEVLTKCINTIITYIDKLNNYNNEELFKD